MRRGSAGLRHLWFEPGQRAAVDGVSLYIAREATYVYVGVTKGGDQIIPPGSGILMPPSAGLILLTLPPSCPAHLLPRIRTGRGSDDLQL